MQVIQYKLRVKGSGSGGDNAERLLMVQMPYSESNLEIAKQEAHNKEIQIVESEEDKLVVPDLKIQLEEAINRGLME